MYARQVLQRQLPVESAKHKKLYVKKWAAELGYMRRCSRTRPVPYASYGTNANKIDVSLPPANIVRTIYDLAIANERLAKMETEQYFACCGKSICVGCVHSFSKSNDNTDHCPFCKTESAQLNK